MLVLGVRGAVSWTFCQFLDTADEAFVEDNKLTFKTEIMADTAADGKLNNVQGMYIYYMYVGLI